jgi:hypothetical protein
MKTQLSKLSVVAGIILAAIVLAMVYSQTAGGKAQVIHQKFDYPIDITFLATEIPCLTEDVHVVGTLRVHAYTVIDAKGGLHIKIQSVADLTAVGLRTGDRYSTQGPEVSVEYDFDGTAPRKIFHHNIVQLVGPGQDGNAMLRELYHFVFNANGVQTLDLEKTEVMCH